MGLALVATGFMFFVAVKIAPFAAADVTLRLHLVAVSTLMPALMLAVSIAKLAKHRFFTAEDINGSAQTDGTEQAKLLQALLQNTLEQVAFAIPVYFAYAVLAPAWAMAALPAAGCMFLVGRVLFFAGYSGGAPSRAFGFAFTFYPTIALMIYALICCVKSAA